MSKDSAGLKLVFVICFDFLLSYCQFSVQVCLLDSTCQCFSRPAAALTWVSCCADGTSVQSTPHLTARKQKNCRRAMCARLAPRFNYCLPIGKKTNKVLCHQAGLSLGVSIKFNILLAGTSFVH